MLTRADRDERKRQGSVVDEKRVPHVHAGLTGLGRGGGRARAKEGHGGFRKGGETTGRGLAGGWVLVAFSRVGRRVQRAAAAQQRRNLISRRLGLHQRPPHLQPSSSIHAMVRFSLAHPRSMGPSSPSPLPTGRPRCIRRHEGRQA